MLPKPRSQAGSPQPHSHPITGGGSTSPPMGTRIQDRCPPSLSASRPRQGALRPALTQPRVFTAALVARTLPALQVRPCSQPTSKAPLPRSPFLTIPTVPLWSAPTPVSSGDVTAHGKAGRGGAGGDHPRHRHTTHIHVLLTHAHTHACTYMHTHPGTCIHTHAPHAHTRMHSIRRHTLAHACITVAHVHADTLSPRRTPRRVSALPTQPGCRQLRLGHAGNRSSHA